MEAHLKSRPKKKAFTMIRQQELKDQAIQKIKEFFPATAQIKKIILMGSSVKGTFGKYEYPGFRGSLYSDFDFIVIVTDDYVIPAWLERELDGKPFPEADLNLAYRKRKVIEDTYDFEIFFIREGSLSREEILVWGEQAGIPMTATSKIPHTIVFDAGEQKETVHLNNESFFHIQDRLGGGKVFANHDRSRFARLGDELEIQGEVNLTRDLHKRGFPVSQVVAEGTLPVGQAYYIEESLGEHIFGVLFKKDTQEYGYVRDDTFEQFLGVMRRYVDAQLKKENLLPHDPDSLSSLIRLETVLAYLPPEKSKEHQFHKSVELAWSKMMTLPWGYIQTDLNPFNILPGGIIDFELAGFGPIGYDIVSCLFFGLMWPKEMIAYRYTEDQIAAFFEMIERTFQKRGLSSPMRYRNEILLLKSIWATGKDHASQKDPTLYKEFWEWRVKLRDWCIDRFVQGEDIDLSVFHTLFL